MQELIYLSYSTEKLLEAVKNPYVKPDQIKSLVKNGADANARIDEDAYTILMTALYNVYNPEVIAELIKAGANVNARNLDYWFETVLLIAAMNNPNPLIIRKLINAGADVNAKNKYGETALFMAAYNNNPAIAKVLIKTGINTEIRNKSGKSPAQYAQEQGNNKTLDFLRFVDEAFFFHDSDWWENLLPDEIWRLIDSGANVNAHQYDKFNKLINTQLREAIKFKADEEILKTLITAGAEDLDDSLMIAAKNNNCSAVSVLLKFGANANYYDSEEDITVLKMAVESNASPEIITLLVNNGAAINDRNNFFGDSPLMLAAYKNEKVIETLINLGANVNITNLDGETALMRCSNIDSALLLINAGADVNAGDIHNLTALMRSVHYDSELVKILIKNGADVNARDFHGKTALDYARENNNIEIINILEELTT